jgi:hypothetical protein
MLLLPLVSRDFVIDVSRSHSDTPPLVGLLWTSVDENGGDMKPLGLKSLINEVIGWASIPVRCTDLAVRH